MIDFFYVFAKVMGDKHIVRCDESIKSDLLISNLKNCDRVISKQTFNLFKSVGELCDLLLLTCIIDETVSEVKPEHGYIRCTIATADEVIDCREKKIGFYHCNFVNAQEVIGACVYGENTSFKHDLVLTDIRLPFGIFTVKGIVSSELSKRLQSRDALMELITSISGKEVLEVSRVACRTLMLFPPEGSILLQSIIYSLREKLCDVEKKTGLDLSITFLSMTINSK